MAYHYSYGICCWSHTETGKLQGIRITSDAILSAMAKASIPVPAGLDRLLSNGCDYSFQDFDVLSGALRVLREHGITERQVEFTVTD